MKSQLAMSVGSWKVSVTTLAWGLSVILHGGLLTASYYATWRSDSTANPEISFAKGEQASRVLVRLTPWPIPAPEEKSQQEALEEPEEEQFSHHEYEIISDPREVEQLPPPDMPSPDALPDPPITQEVVPSRSHDQDSDVPTSSKILVTQEAPALTPDTPPAANLHDMKNQPQPVLEVIISPVKQTDRIISTPRTKEQIDQSPLHEAMAPDDVVAKKKSQPTSTEESTPQSSGVETGVETLNLPKPRYPSLSRRQGEQGVVWLLVEVLPDGSVGEVVVLQDAGFRRLAQAAIDAVRKGHFKPATRDGHAVKDTVRIPFRFVLN